MITNISIIVIIKKSTTTIIIIITTITTMIININTKIKNIPMKMIMIVLVQQEKYIVKKRNIRLQKVIIILPRKRIIAVGVVIMNEIRKKRKSIHLMKTTMMMIFGLVLPLQMRIHMIGIEPRKIKINNLATIRVNYKITKQVLVVM